MLLLIFFILLTQTFSYWIFEPFTSFVEYVLEIRLFPVIALVGFFFLFSAKNIKKIK